MSYLDAYKSHSDALRMNPNDVVAQIMLSKLEPATVNLFEAAKKRAQKLAEVHLNRWMFHSKKANYTQIASDLMDNTRWLTHGQMIGYQAAQELELEVQYLQPEPRMAIVLAVVLPPEACGQRQPKALRI